MNEVDELGIRRVVKEVLEKIDPECKRSIHMSFDIDALDTLEAPSTGTSVRGGLTLREGLFIMEEVCRTGRLAAIDLVEVNPRLGNPEDVKKTVDAAVNLIAAACGYNRAGNVNKMDKIKV